MGFNYSKLKGKIVEVFGTQTAFAQEMGWSERTLSLKLNNKRFWKQPEIAKARELLLIGEEEIPVYFFTPKVQHVEQVDELQIENII